MAAACGPVHKGHLLSGECCFSAILPISPDAVASCVICLDEPFPYSCRAGASMRVTATVSERGCVLQRSFRIRAAPGYGTGACALYSQCAPVTAYQSAQTNIHPARNNLPHTRIPAGTTSVWGLRRRIAPRERERPQPATREIANSGEYKSTGMPIE